MTTPLADLKNIDLRNVAEVGDITLDPRWRELLGLPPLSFVVAAGGLSGDALEEFNRLHPRGFGGRFGHKTGVPDTGRAAVLAGDFRGLTRIGGQLGSNPAALFEDESGQKWYVKAQQSAEHANNEALASALYRKLSVVTPEVHTGSGAPGLGDGPQTASEWMDVDPPDFEDKYFKRDTHGDFGAHALLANWDVAGLGMDNIMVEKGIPFPVMVDVGGSLLFRAQGAPKGDAFGDVPAEWDTLRDPRYAPQASRLFGDMTAEELAQAAERVEKITPKQIRDLVAEYDMPPSLAERLIARQKDIVKRGEQLRLDLEVQADPGRKSGRAALAAAGARLSDKPAGQTYDPSAELTFAEDPGWPESKRKKVADILRFYRNGTYRQIGEFQRGQSDDDIRIQDTDEEGNLVGRPRTEKVYEHMAYLYDAFDVSPLQEPVLLYRGVGRPETVWGEDWRPGGDMTGVEWTEPAPTSSSASESVARIFSVSGALMRLHVPAGVGAIQLSGWSTPDAHNREAELVLQPGLRYRIVGDRTETREVAGRTLSKRLFDVVVEAIPDED